MCKLNDVKVKLEHNLEGHHWEETWEIEDVPRFRAWLWCRSACMAGMEPWLLSMALHKLGMVVSPITLVLGRRRRQEDPKKERKREKENHFPNWYYTIQNASRSLIVTSWEIQSFLWLWIWLEYLSQRDWKFAQFYWTSLSLTPWRRAPSGLVTGLTWLHL